MSVRAAGARRAFTLVEIFVATAVALISLGSFYTVIADLAETELRIEEEETIRDRLTSAAAELIRITRTCGLGVPIGRDDYQRAFGMMAYEFAPMSWRGPLYIAEPTSMTQGRSQARAYIVYAVPTDSTVVDAVSTDAATFSLTISADVNSDGIAIDDDSLAHASASPRSQKNWILLSATEPAGAPLWITRRPDPSPRGTDLRVSRYAPGSIYVPRGARVFLLRCADIMTSPWMDEGVQVDWNLSVDAHDDGGRQPIVTGIVDMRFEFDEESATLRAWILARGNKRYPTQVSSGSIKDWPDEWASDVSESARHYRLGTAAIEIPMGNL